jgi:hypothetical protein
LGYPVYIYIKINKHLKFIVLYKYVKTPDITVTDIVCSESQHVYIFFSHFVCLRATKQASETDTYSAHKTMEAII